MESVFQAFKSYSSDEADSATIDNLDRAVRTDFSQAYHISYDGNFFLDEKEELSLQEKALIDELVQHLADLLYLPDDFYIKFHKRNNRRVALKQWHVIRKGLFEFIHEDDWIIQTGLFAKIHSNRGLIFAKDMVPVLVQRLNQLTTFDGDFVIPGSLTLGDQNSYTRSVIYRLRALGAYFGNENPGPILDKTALIRVHNLEFILRSGSGVEVDFRSTVIEPDFLKILCDAQKLFELYLESQANRILFYKFADATEKVRANSQRLIVWDKKFIDAPTDRKFKNRVKNANLPYPQVQKFIEGRGSVEAAASTASNKLGIHLLQIKLWMGGFYNGEIDGEWGAMSHEALQDFLDQEHKFLAGRNKYMLYIEEEHWAINLPRVGDILVDYCIATDEDEKQKEDVLFGEINQENEPLLQERILTKPGTKMRSVLKKARRKRRRVYLGLRSLIASALRGLGRIKDWLAKKVAKITGAIVSFFKAISKRIREGIATFFSAFKRFSHFILGKPIFNPVKIKELPGNTTFVFTRFDFDRDAVNLYSSTIDKRLMRRHTRELRNLTMGLSLFLYIATVIVDLITVVANLTNPYGWIKLGIKIGREISEIIKRSKGRNR